MLCAASMLVLLSSARAQEPAQEPAGRPVQAPRWSLGLAVLSSPEPYVGASNETRVVPLIQYRSERLTFEGLGLRYHLARSGRLGLDAVLRARLDGFDADDSALLRGMEDRRESLDAGLAMTWDLGALELGRVRLGRAGLGARLTADVLGRSHGLEAALELELGRRLADGRLLLAPSLAAVWQSDDLVDYYYGVRPSEAVPGRPAHAGRAAVQLELGVMALYRLSPRVGLLALARAERLAPEVRSSPIVDDRQALLGLVGLSYSF
jgi:outer membrane protein